MIYPLLIAQLGVCDEPYCVASNGFIIEISIINPPIRRTGGNNLYNHKKQAINIAENSNIKIIVYKDGGKYTKVQKINKNKININNVKIEVIDNKVSIKLK